jgi:hypothetical protein
MQVVVALALETRVALELAVLAAGVTVLLEQVLLEELQQVAAAAVVTLAAAQVVAELSLLDMRNKGDR